jgi:DAK2 domain fusion protein YloV
MFLCGAQNLEANKAWINELNVFPVPDGDTGTNMTMTVVSAVREVTGLSEHPEMKAICKAISSGSLRGARGNSGVILSQLFRGFCKVARDNSEVDVKLTADAFDKAVETAYKAVMKPKEGTILTVAKGAAEKARELADGGVTDFAEFLPQVIQYADDVLAKTPEMLPVLKQAGVVDSGGQGLVQFLKGALQGFEGKEPDLERILNPDAAAEEEQAPEAAQPELRYGYEADFVILLDKTFNQKLENDFRNYLNSIGDHVTVQTRPTAVKVEIQTNDPGLILQRGLMYGQVAGIRIENLRMKDKELPSFTEESGEKKQEQEEAPAPAPDAPRKSIGIIAVCAGDGLAEIFRGLGVDMVIQGGQTMNPSTADILDAVDKVNADTVFILPNNKNIILAANQAAAMDGDKSVVVIPTKTVPQGITAVINFMPDQDAEANRQNMVEEISRVKSAEVTYAVRDTVIDDVEIHQGNMMAIGDEGILEVGEDLNETAAKALGRMITDDTELVSIYYGAQTSKEDAEALRSRVCEEHPSCEVELQEGGQPVYYYILSAE